MGIAFNIDVLNEINKGGVTVNEALNNVYEKEIKTFKADNGLNPTEKITAFDVAFFNNGLNKKTTIGEAMNRISTQGNGDYLIPMYISSVLEEYGASDDVLQYVLAQTKQEASAAIKTYQLDLSDEKNKEAGRLVRVSEGADLPLAKLTLGSKAISLYKQGRAVEITYEALRRMDFNTLDLTLRTIQRDIGGQNLYGVMDVALNGDGNDNAASKLITTATANVITQKELNDAMFDFFLLNNIGANVIACSPAMAKLISPFTYDGSLMGGASATFRLDFPQLGMQEAKVIMVKDMPTMNSKQAVVLMRKEEAIVKHIEANSQINEMDTFIRNQTTLSTISEVSGFSKFNKNSVAYIEIK